MCLESEEECDGSAAQSSSFFVLLVFPDCSNLTASIYSGIAHYDNFHSENWIKQECPIWLYIYDQLVLIFCSNTFPDWDRSFNYISAMIWVWKSFTKYVRNIDYYYYYYYYYCY